MESPSSTSSFERPRDVARVPTAFLLALVMLVGLEIVVRQIDPPALIAYDIEDTLAYEAVRHYLRFVGPADVGFVGSSRMLNAVVMPDLHRELSMVLDRPVSVANYALPGANADEVAAVVRLILRQEKRPKILVYGVTPKQLAAANYDLDKRATLWSLSDWRRERAQTDEALFRVLPDVIRNEIENVYRTFAYRKIVSVRIGEAVLNRSRIPCPINGELSKYFDRQPNRSLITHPALPRMVKKYFKRRMTGDEYLMGGVQTNCMEEVIRLTREAGVELIFVELPQSRILLNHYPGDSYNRFVAEVSRIATAHDVRFVRTRDLVIDFRGADFADFSHLNLPGAKRLSSVLAGRVLIPALRKLYNEDSPDPTIPRSRPEARGEPSRNGE